MQAGPAFPQKDPCSLSHCLDGETLPTKDSFNGRGFIEVDVSIITAQKELTVVIGIEKMRCDEVRIGKLSEYEALGGSGRT